MGDGGLPYYFGGTMTRTTGEVSLPSPTHLRVDIDQANYMIFTFNGTAVYIYGSKRPNHGIYSGELVPFSQIEYVLILVSLDGGDALLQSGRGGNPGDFQALLYQKEDLDPAKEHNVVVTNLPSRTDRAGELFILGR